MPFILTIAAVAGIVVSVVLVQRGSLIIGAVAYLLIASVFGFDYLNFPCGSITMSLDRIVFLWLVGTGLVQWRLGILDPKPITKTEKALFAFFAILIINTFLFDWRRGGAGQVPIVPHLLNGYLIPLVLYWVVRNSAITERQVRWLQYLFIGFGIYLSLTAFCEISGTWSLVFPRYIADPELGIHFGRARGPFIQSVRLGMYLIAGVASMWMLLSWHGQWGRWGRLLAVLLLPLFMGALFITYTRTNWIGVAVVTMIICSYSLQGAFRRVAIASLVGGAILVVVASNDSLVSMKREFGTAETARSTKMRVSFAYVSWLMFQERPISGFGFGHFPHENIPFLEDRSTGLLLGEIRGFIHHNTFLSLLVELGIFGLLFYCFVLFGWGRNGWRLWKDSTAPSWMRGQSLMFLAFLGSYGVQMLFHDVSYSPVENGSLFLLAGLTSGMYAMRQRGMRMSQGWNTQLGPRENQKRTVAASCDDRPTPVAREPVVGQSALHPPTIDRRGVAYHDRETCPSGGGVQVCPRPAITPRPWRVKLFGVTIDAIRMSEAVARIQEWIQDESETCRYVVTPNVDHVVMLHESTALRAVYDEASLVLADGAPVVIAARWLGKEVPERVAGSDLVPALFSASSFEHPITVYLLGAMPGVAERAAENIHRRWPTVRVVGSYSPPFGFERSPERNREILDRIDAASPDVLVVGLGAPKQELWVHRHHREISAKVALCVGATIDFLANEKPRAPLWMRKSGLEWCHRLLSEPRRLVRRYARDAWVFPRLVLRQWMAT